MIDFLLAAFVNKIVLIMQKIFNILINAKVSTVDPA